MSQNPYFDTSMQLDPTGLDEERQRKVANRLRDMSQTGAMGSTSQIKEISGGGQGLMTHSMDIGKQMGLDRAKKREEANRNERAKQTRLARSADRAQYQTQKDKDQYIGTRPERDQIESAVADMSLIQRLTTSYEDGFGGGELIGALDRKLAEWDKMEPGMAKLARKKVLDAEKWAVDQGMMDAEGDPKQQMSPEELEAHNTKRQQWFTDFNLLYTLPKRNAIFGATLTDSERSSWESATVNAGSTDAQIRGYMTRLQSIYEDVMDRMESKMKMSNWSTDYRTGISDLRSKYSGAAAGQPQTVAAPEPAVDTAPEGVPQSEWDGATSEEKADYYRAMEE